MRVALGEPLRVTAGDDAETATWHYLCSSEVGDSEAMVEIRQDQFVKVRWSYPID